MSVAVTDTGIELVFGSGTLCSGCAVDLGVDGSIASAYHSRWLPLASGNKAVSPRPPTCGSAREALPGAGPTFALPLLPLGGLLSVPVGRPSETWDWRATGATGGGEAGGKESLPGATPAGHPLDPRCTHDAAEAALTRWPLL